MEKKRWWSVSWKRVGICLLILFAGLYLIGPLVLNVEVWYFARETARDSPEVAVIPSPLPDRTLADLGSGMDLTTFGYTMRLPWQKVSIRRDFKEMTSVGFEDGSSLLLMVNEPDFVSSLRGLSPKQKAEASAIYGPDTLSSSFQFAEAEMNSRPSDVSLFHSRRRNARAFTLMQFKSLDMTSSKTSIHPIAGPQVRGFQIGDPQVQPYIVKLMLFDGMDHKFEFLFKKSKASAQASLTQAQINAIVASIKSEY